MECPNRRRRRLDPFLDPLAHLVGGPLGEGHDENRGRRNAPRHEPAESLRDDRGFPRPRSRHHPHGAGTERGRRQLLTPESHDSVDRPMRTRSTRTFRPRSGRLSLARMASASSLS